MNLNDLKIAARLKAKKEFGGQGSGNYGHAGRPGERGGSASEGGGKKLIQLEQKGITDPKALKDSPQGKAYLAKVKRAQRPSRNPTLANAPFSSGAHVSQYYVKGNRNVGLKGQVGRYHKLIGQSKPGDETYWNVQHQKSGEVKSVHHSEILEPTTKAIVKARLRKAK